MSFAIKIKDAISGRRYEFHEFDDDYADAAPEYSPNGFGEPMTMPLKMKAANTGDWWLLPWEPYISVAGKNVVIKRNVAKAKNLAGSIKERWTQDDWEITIEGIFTNPETNRYPKDDIEKLKTICEANEVIDVECRLFAALGITKMVIEDYELPYTKGPENQEWSIKAYSDRSWELFIKDE